MGALGYMWHVVGGMLYLPLSACMSSKVPMIGLWTDKGEKECHPFQPKSMATFAAWTASHGWLWCLQDSNSQFLDDRALFCQAPYSVVFTLTSWFLWFVKTGYLEYFRLKSEQNSLMVVLFFFSLHRPATSYFPLLHSTYQPKRVACAFTETFEIINSVIN